MVSTPVKRTKRAKLMGKALLKLKMVVSPEQSTIMEHGMDIVRWFLLYLKITLDC